MTITNTRRALMFGAAAMALAGPAGAEITVSRRFRAGRPVVLNGPEQVERLSSVLQGDVRAARSTATLVHIPIFRVEIAKQVRKNARTRGIGGASQTSTFVLENVDDAAVQAMTQGLYEQFVAGLRAQGYRVASIEETRADVNLARFFNDRPSPLNGNVADGQSTFYVPQGMSVNPVTGDTRVPQGLGTFGVVGEMSNTAMSLVRAAMAGSIVLMPRFAVGFVDVEASSDRFLGDLGNSASVSGRGAMRLLPEATRVEIFAPTTPGQFRQDWVALTSPLLLSGVDVGPLHDATTDAQRRDALAGQAIAVLGALAGLGGGGTSQYNTNAMTAGPRLAETLMPYLEAVQGQFLLAVRPTGT